MPNKEVMSALAIIVNPIYQVELFQFYITSQFNLGLAKWSTNPGAVKATSVTADVTDITGPCWFPSSIATVQNQNEIKVFGFVMRTDNKKTYVKVAQLSPAMSSVSEWDLDSTYGSRMAVASDNLGSAWLYYLKDGEIICKAISETSTTDVNLNNDDTPSGDTYLSAYCDSNGVVYVIYQLKSGHIRELNSSTKDNATVTNVGTIKKTTPMAVCSTPNGDKIFLYYLDQNNTVYRVIKEGTEWHDPEVVGGKNAHITDDFTQLAVMADVDVQAKSNSLFFIQNGGGEKYTRLTDKWKY